MCEFITENDKLCWSQPMPGRTYQNNAEPGGANIANETVYKQLIV